MKELDNVVCKLKLTYNAYNIKNMVAYSTKDTLFCALEYDALLVDVL